MTTSEHTQQSVVLPLSPLYDRTTTWDEQPKRRSAYFTITLLKSHTAGSSPPDDPHKRQRTNEPIVDLTQEPDFVIPETPNSASSPDLSPALNSHAEIGEEEAGEEDAGTYAYVYTLHTR